MTRIGIEADSEIQLQDMTIINPKMTGHSGLVDVKHQKLGIAHLCEREADQQISNRIAALSMPFTAGSHVQGWAPSVLAAIR
jgi:hypothetical protein